MFIDEFRDFCISFPNTSESLPFGPDTLVFKVHNKMFALIALDDTPYRANLKCKPDLAIELREDFPDAVFPGYHMNKQHWNTIIPEHNSLTRNQVQSWIQDSYNLVFSSLPKKIRELGE